MQRKRERRKREREGKTTVHPELHGFFSSYSTTPQPAFPCVTSMTRCLVLDALLVVSQCLLETEEQLGEFHLTCRAMRYTPHLACYLGATALAVLGNNIGWWISHNVRQDPWPREALSSKPRRPGTSLVPSSRTWSPKSCFGPSFPVKSLRNRKSYVKYVFLGATRPCS